MSLIVVGMNHRSAPVEVRERIALRPAETVAAGRELKSTAGLSEVVILSTCNRTEFYAMDDSDSSAEPIRRMIADEVGDDAASRLYVMRDRDAVAHLFRVASGMDSMILGEAQIHGQVRDAWQNCREESGAALNRLFQTALLVASRVREETGIGRGAASVSSSAVQLAKKIFGSLAGRRAMVLGAGDVAALALECFRREGVKVAIVANRTHARAVQLAAQHDAVAMNYEECWADLVSVDVLLCSTASPHAFVGVEHVMPALEARGDRPLCIIDIAVPRDVHADVGSLDNVFLYDLDDLQAAAAANLERRHEDVPAAEQIIAAETEKYWEWLAGLAAVPVVTEFRAQMDRVREAELTSALRRIDGLSTEQAAGVEKFSRALMNKFLHEPSVRLRAAAANGRGLGVVDAARYLFALEHRPAEVPPVAGEEA
ncbi:MAG TPA: glutamyl-tRNA reductase [Gemmatimonadaceae bacterium]|nr:glutamyl-tRNA reductase [Gemmatimonadaceae bacterium]